MSDFRLLMFRILLCISTMMSTKFCATHCCAPAHPSRETRESGAGDSGSTLRERRRGRSLEALLQSTKIFAWHPNKAKRTELCCRALQRGSKGKQKIFCFFLEMQFLNGYKCDVIDIEILRFSSTLFQLTGNKVSCGGTVSYPIRVRLLDCSSKFYFKEGGFES